VTALAFYRPSNGPLLLLAAEGVYLKVYEYDSLKLLGTCRVFQSQTVHGIAVHDEIREKHALQAVIWGGMSIMLLDASTLEQIISGALKSLEGFENYATDWILDVALAPDSNDDCVFITAHNETVRARRTSNRQGIHLQKLDSPSRSILYSAHLTFDSTSCVTVAAGTVFGEIIVWQYLLSQDSSAKSQVLHTFTGHEGSIFGVNISPTIMDAHGNPIRLLASCSDDRTIRVWDIASPGQREGMQSLIDGSIARETGFGPNDDDKNQQSKDSNRCVAVVMAHASRIWHVKFHLPLPGSLVDAKTINLLSFGEDATYQQWLLEFDTPALESPSDPKSAKLQHVQTGAFHTGKHIWSAAIDVGDKNERILATGGADGSIALSLVPIKPATPQDSVKLETPDSKLPVEMTKLDELGTSYGIIGMNIQTTVEEILKELDISHLDPISKTVLPQPESGPDTGNAESATIENPAKKKKKPVKIPTDAINRYAFVGINEFIVTTTFGRVLLAKIVNDRLCCEAVAMPEGAEHDLRSYAVISSLPELGIAVMAGAKGNIYLYAQGHIQTIGTVQGKIAALMLSAEPRLRLLVTILGSDEAIVYSFDSVAELSSLSTSVVTLSPGFIVTSMCTTEGLLILGSRNGRFELYLWSDLKRPIQAQYIDAIKVADAITRIVQVPSKEEQENLHILATSRSGSFCILSVRLNLAEKDLKGSEVVTVHHSFPPFGQIEDAYFSSANGELYLSGFRGKRFIVWNESSQQEIASVECGGAHRSYATLGFNGCDNGGKFVYTKASKMYLHVQNRDSHIQLKKGGHGREIKACAVSPDQKFFATGAEDTTIRIWRYDPQGSNGRKFNNLAVIQKHTAGIQHLQWHGSEYLFSSGGNEEFYVWAISEIPGFGVGVICEASCPEQTEEKDLRVMTFDVTEIPDAGLLITLALSDSTLRSYLYSKATGFQRFAQGQYTSACLMQVKHVIKVDTCYLLTAATDGYLAFWRLSAISDILTLREVDIEFLSGHKVHQSAVKCLDLSMVDADRFVVATGGDDNAVAVTIYEGTKARTIMVPSAHAAAVTALTLVPGKQGSGSSQLVSSSNDQRVITWAIDHQSGGIRVVDDVFTSIADVGDMDVLHPGSHAVPAKVLVVGNGMDAWESRDV
jgi:WD40 repeat protein